MSGSLPAGSAGRPRSWVLRMPVPGRGRRLLSFCSPCFHFHLRAGAVRQPPLLTSGAIKGERLRIAGVTAQGASPRRCRQQGCRREGRLCPSSSPARGPSSIPSAASPSPPWGLGPEPPRPSSCLPHLGISSTPTGHLVQLRPLSWAPDPTAANAGALPSCRLLGGPRLASSPTTPHPPPLEVGTSLSAVGLSDARHGPR